MDLSGYLLEPLREAPASTLYRGRRLNSIPVLVLAPAVGEFGAECARRLEQEFALAQLLDPAWATKPIALAQHEGRLVLVLDDCGGRPLGELLGKSLDIKRFLSIAINLATALDHAHRCGLVHKDIKPANVLVDEAANVRLTGFAFATRLPRERQAPGPPDTIAGTLAYMAPEQTGRMNRSIDARSDLYSLGVTLYEMLTGGLPFVAMDAMELIHCHIARKPAPPSEHAPDVPAPLDAIVLKLLSKTAEDRYQTATGVTHDLQRCLSEWNVRRRIEAFALGAQDHSGRLTVPETLYGREREIETLLAAFQRVTTQGITEFVVVAGPSGVGKSSIVNELHKELILTRGLFGAGKFDSQRPDVPYATLTQALRQVVQQLLNRSDAELGQWRRALVDALGLNASLIVDLIPQLSLIVGELPFAPEVPPQDRQVRFQQAFRRFIGVFAQPKHPLVLFLDDLQWIDPATLDLLERLANDRSFRNVLFVGAYRQTELHSEHRLVRTLKRLTDAGVLREVQLGPLTNVDVRNLVADALRSEPLATGSLGDLVFEKTEGNPFFAIQFLTALEDKGHLFFDVQTRSWRWDIERIRADSITDQVAELMAAKLGRYEDVTLQLIVQLGCLGSNARTTTLASLLGLPAEQVDFALREPVRAGLVRQLEGGYAFAHDRVQEAAYALIAPADRARYHLQIGRVLAANIQEAELEDNIFEIVNQFNRGADLIRDGAERMRLAKFNLVAGNRARASTAYESALVYFTIGQSLLQEDAEARESQLSFDMNLHRAECELWTGDLISAEARLVKLSLRAATLRDLARVVWVAVALYFKLDRNDQAVEMCLEYLRRVGIDWSQHPTDDDVQREYDELFYQLSRRPVETLADLPPMSDRNDQTTMNVLAALQTSAFYSDRNLWLLLLGRMANLSLVKGNCEDSTLAYSLVGLVLGPRFGQYRTGLRLGRLAFDLVETGGFERFKPRVYANFASGSMPWTTALRDCVAPNRRAIEAALGAGDRIYAVWSRSQLIANLLACGTPLAEVRREAEDALRYAKGASFGYLADILTAQLKLVLALQGETQAPSSSADAPEEQSTEGYLQTDPPGSVRVVRYWTRKLQASFLADDCSSALSAAVKARASLSTTPLYFERAEYHLYAALALASRLASLPDPARSRDFAELVGHHDLLAAWAEACPENFTDRSTMVAAEIARLEGRELDAERLYDSAVRTARDQGFIQNEAIAYELAARFHTARGLKTIGDDCLRGARSCFVRWGAHGKVRQLNQLYPHLNDESSPAAGSIRESELQELDLAAIVEMSQTIAGEIVLDRLIERLMTVVLKQAGAVRGLLLLPRDGEMRIVSRAVTGRGGIAVEPLDMPRLAEELPESLLQYVARSFDNVVLDDASRQNEYSADPYILAKRPRSILCMPLVNQNRLAGVLYLENNLAPFAFSRGQRTALHILASQAAISLENANLYSDLHQSQEQARRAEREFRRSFDSIPALAWSAQPDGTPDFFNKQWYAYTGMSAGEAPVRWTRAFHPDEAQQVADKWAQIVRAGVSGEIEARISRPNSDPRIFLIRTTPIRDEKGAIVKWYGTATDIEDLKRAEQALRRSEAYLADAQKMSHTGSWAFDLTNRRVIHSSEEHHRLFGFDPAGAMPRWEDWTQRLHPDDRQRTIETIEQGVREQADLEFDCRIVHPDGTVKYVHATGHPVFGAPGDAIVCAGTTIDVTQRRLAEEALRDSEEQWKAAFENNPTMYFMVDIDGIVVSVNSFGARELGYTVDELKGGSLLKVFYAADRAAAQREMTGCIQQPSQAMSFELRMVRRDGSVLFVRETARAMLLKGQPVILIACEDVTDRKDAESLTTQVFESAPDGICIVGRDYRYRRSNPVYAKSWGSPAAPIVGMHVSEALGADAFNRTLKPRLDRCFAGEQVTFEWFSEFRGPRYLAVSYSPLRSGSGEVEAALVIQRDLTAHMHASEALREAQAQLAHVNRVATMGQLTASIAHEVNQPIAATVTNAQAALRWLASSPPNLGEVRQSLEDIVRSGNRAGDVVARIRALVKNAPPQNDRLDINEAIHEVLALTRSEVGKNSVVLRLQFAEHLPLIEGDRVQLQQVMLNLIINAIEATSAIDDGSRELLISTGTAEAGGVFVAVRDSGPGLNPQDLEHVFDAFYTTKSGGMGMGLAICRSIIEAHGGPRMGDAEHPAGGHVPVQRACQSADGFPRYSGSRFLDLE